MELKWQVVHISVKPRSRSVVKKELISNVKCSDNN